MASLDLPGDHHIEGTTAVNLFTVTWWIYFTFVALTTLSVLALLLTTVYFFTRKGCCRLCSPMSICTLVLMAALFSVVISLRCFALAWEDEGCMVLLLVLAVIELLFQHAMIRFSDTAAPEQLTVPHLLMLMASNMIEIVLLALLILELRR